ncbi:unnamed protein product, partial [marine sediment metagenome]
MYFGGSYFGGSYFGSSYFGIWYEEDLDSGGGREKKPPGEVRGRLARQQEKEI